MKKWLLILVVLLLAGAAYVYFGNPPTAWMKKVKQHLPSSPSSDTTTVYKWRDPQGSWQITDTPPDGAVPYETLQYHNDTNLMPAEQITGKPKD